MSKATETALSAQTKIRELVETHVFGLAGERRAEAMVLMRLIDAYRDAANYHNAVMQIEEERKCAD